MTFFCLMEIARALIMGQGAVRHIGPSGVDSRDDAA
jgi:hypothetical protein